MTERAHKSGSVFTFYSFKGGVGRSMAAANVAALLAKWGHQVLLVDFDLEAPGIEHYFSNYSFKGSSSETPGLVDLVLAFKEGQPMDWKRALCRAFPFGSRSEAVTILTAGRRDRGYLGRLQSIDWRDLFVNHRLGDYLEQLRAEWIDEFGFVLLDSRTGYTDVGGICTIQLPDILIPVLTTNNQNLKGTLDVIEEVREGRKELPEDRGHLFILPVPSRVESWTEYSAAKMAASM
jgi:cellulose biosynthesis protein BcsQ